jgi:hypothetical protein
MKGQQFSMLGLSAHGSNLGGVGLKRDVTLAANGNQIGQGVRFADRVWNDVVHVEALLFTSQSGLEYTAPLARIFVSLARFLGRLFPVPSTAMMPRRAALPGRVALPANVLRLPRRVTPLRTEQASIGSKGLEWFAAFSAKGAEQAATTPPAFGRTKSRYAPVRHLFKSTATDFACECDALLRLARTSAFVSTFSGAEAASAVIRLKRRVADFADLLHGEILAQFALPEAAE